MRASRMIYEGANGIQALDLVGRKLRQGRRPRRHGVLQRGADLSARSTPTDEAMNAYRQAARQVARRICSRRPMWFMQNAMAKPDNAGAGSTDYMHLFGLVALGYMWCRIAEAALAKLPKANGAAARIERQARHRALLHGANAAGNRDAARAHPGGRRLDHGIAGRRVLDSRSIQDAVSAFARSRRRGAAATARS